MNKGEWGKIKAFFDLETEEGFVVKGFKLVQGINGLFVGFPSQKGNDDEYYDTVWAEKDLREQLSQLAIDFFGQEIMPTETQQPKAKEEGSPSSMSTESVTSSFDSSDPITDDDIPF
tara:strand:+ start:195 stop:545 length:351 start_codon:yes stop_codon:yes gene_type:complete